MNTDLSKTPTCFLKTLMVLLGTGLMLARDRQCSETYKIRCLDIPTDQVNLAYILPLVKSVMAAKVVKSRSLAKWSQQPDTGEVVRDHDLFNVT